MLDLAIAPPLNFLNEAVVRASDACPCTSCDLFDGEVARNLIWVPPQTCYGAALTASLRGPAVQAASRPDKGSQRRAASWLPLGAPQNEFGLAPAGSECDPRLGHPRLTGFRKCS